MKKGIIFGSLVLGLALLGSMNFAYASSYHGQHMNNNSTQHHVNHNKMQHSHQEHNVMHTENKKHHKNGNHHYHNNSSQHHTNHSKMHNTHR